MQQEVLGVLTQLLYPETQDYPVAATQTQHFPQKLSAATTQTQDTRAMKSQFQPPKPNGKPLSTSARILLGAGLGAGLVVGWHTWTTMNVTLAKLLLGAAAGGGLVALVTVGAGQYRVVHRDPEQTEETLEDLWQNIQAIQALQNQPFPEHSAQPMTQPLPEWGQPIEMVPPRRSASAPIGMNRREEERTEPVVPVDESYILNGDFPEEEETPEFVSNGRG